MATTMTEAPPPKKRDDEVLLQWARKAARNYKHDGKALTGTPEMQKAHYICHGIGLDEFAEEESRCHSCQIANFPWQDEYPITIKNRVDSACLPESFTFIDQVKLSPSIPTTAEEFYLGCECVMDHCTTQSCVCQADVDSDQVGKQKVNAYHGLGDKNGRLRTDYLDHGLPIYECGPKCKCPRSCPNRVVQQGRKVPLQIFRTQDGRGWGVKCPVKIKRGQYVDSYLGELLTPDEAQARRDNAVSSQEKDVYLFALDKFTNRLDPDSRLHQAYEIDGEFYSGPTRFINHSCAPNLRIFAVVKNVADRPFHGLAFFALEDVEAGTELTFDYLDGIEEGAAEEENKEKKKCLCGARTCRGYLF